MKFNDRTLLAGAAALLPLLLGSQALRAADERFPISAAAVLNFPPSTQAAIIAQAQQHAGGLYQHLLLKMDEADRVCGLSDRQRAKLRVAAKGAVDHAITRWLETGSPMLAIPQFQQQFQQAQQQAQQIEQILGDFRTRQQQFELQERQSQLARRAVQRRIEALGDDAEANANKAKLEEQLRQIDRQQAQLKVQRQAMEQQVLQITQLLAARQPAAAAPPGVPGVVIRGNPQLAELAARQAAVARAAAPAQIGFVVRDGVQVRVDNGAVVLNGRAVANPGAAVAAPDATAIEKEKIWTAAFDGTLTTAQKKLLTAADDERVFFVPKSPPERIVAEMDRLLLLDSKQREQLIVLADKVIASYGANAAAFRNPNLHPASLLAAVKSRLSADELQGILSETQLSAWTGDSHQPTSRPVDRYMPAAQPVPAVPAGRF